MSEHSTPVYRSDMRVELIDFMGGDQRIVQAARVSTKGVQSVEASESEGLIRYLTRNRHASPIEHSSFTFLVETPIFVAREFMRHRIASYNEWSGRYSVMGGEFYIPAPGRPLTQVGKVGEYRFEAGTAEQQELVEAAQKRTIEAAWAAYREQLDAGIAREVARMALPLSLYTAFYVTMNARGLTNFLSLRTTHEEAAVRSTPQLEIQMVADLMEEHFAQRMPVLHRAWHENGRVSL